MTAKTADKLYGVLNAVRVALKMGDPDDLKDLLPRIDEVLKEAEAQPGPLSCCDCDGIFPTMSALVQHAAETGHDVGSGCECADPECPNCNGGCGGHPKYYADVDGKEVYYCEDCAVHAEMKGIETNELAGRFRR